MTEDEQGPTQEQSRELLAETAALLTLASTPNQEPVYIAAQAQRAFNLSPPHALGALAVFGKVRYWRVANEIGPDEHGLSRFAFPREALMNDVPADQFTVTACAVELVEALIRHDRDLLPARGVIPPGASPREAVERLKAHDFDGYLALMGVVLVLGTMVVDIVPEIQNILELVSVEAVTAEQQWYANGQSYE